MGKKLLLTGATGQIGGAVARALAARGDDVRCLVRDPDRAAHLAPLELITGDITDPSSLGAAVAGREAVLHLAGFVSFHKRDRPLLERINVDGTRYLIDAAADAGVGRFLMTSSIAALGWVAGGGEGDETTAYNWQGDDIAYFDTKRAAQEAVLAHRRVEGLTVNPGMVLGEGDLSRNGGQMLEQLHEGRLPGFPTGQTTVATLEDVVAGHLAALDRGRVGQTYVLGGTTLPFSELLARLAAVVGVPAPTRALPPWLMQLVSGAQALGAAVGGSPQRITPALVKITSRNRKYSSAKAITELGYAPQSLEAGAEACWRWLQDNPRES